MTAAAYNGYDQATSVTPNAGTATPLTAAGTTNSELVTQGSSTLRNGLTGVQAITTGASTTYFQRDPQGGLLGEVTGTGATGEYYYVFDGQANVIRLVDAAGTERARYTYDPYGAHDTATAFNGTLPDNPYRYATGRAVATNASNQVVLYQFGDRYYQRSIGRWTQQDNLESLGDPAQGNRYAYVGDDPINSLDPTGTLANTFGLCYGEILAGCVSYSTDSEGNSAITVGVGVGVGGEFTDTASGGTVNTGFTGTVGGCAIVFCFGVSPTLSNGYTSNSFGFGYGGGAGLFAVPSYSFGLPSGWL